MTYSDETIKALAWIRKATSEGMLRTSKLGDAFRTLDNAGVFAALDEQTDYASAEEILAEIALASVPNTADPAEWGDTMSADMAGRHRRVPLGEPLYGDEAERMRIALRQNEV